MPDFGKKELGEIRRGQVITTYGPGSIVDLVPAGLRHGRTQVSVVMSGIDQWDEDAKFSGLGSENQQVIKEPRLEKILGVQYFRQPPVVAKKNFQGGAQTYETPDRLIGIEFPKWLMCPKCRHLKHSERWDRKEPSSPECYCAECDIPVTATRFIQICEEGCLDDFPWDRWAHWDSDFCEKPKLYLEARGAGLGGLVVQCRAEGCEAGCSLEECFSGERFQSIKCKGRRPWLGDKRPNCNGAVRAAYRGSSNVHFPVIQSALSIPPWSNRLQAVFTAAMWRSFVDLDDANLLKALEAFWESLYRRQVEPLNIRTPSQLQGEILRRKSMLDSVQESSFRPDEYEAFMDESNEEGGDFEIRPGQVPTLLRGTFGKVVEARRLRQVRALRGFTRVKPLEEGGKLAPLGLRRNPDWLPAVEVRGEGIFLQLHPEAVKTWEKNPKWIHRAETLPKMPAGVLGVTFGGEEAEEKVPITPRLLLLHTFSHALLKGLVLESGYSAASLAERLYCGEPGTEMAGVLVYTAAGDSDGTLGGLCRQASPERLEPVLLSSIRSMAWCSNDPLCYDDRMSDSEPKNKAACHACVFLPETACEHFNYYLDRRALVGTPDDRSLGFFGPLLDEGLA